MRNKIIAAVVLVSFSVFPHAAFGVGSGVSGCANQGGPGGDRHKCEDCPPPEEQENHDQCEASHINNVYLSHTHIAVDYDSRVKVSGCQPCGGAPSLTGDLSGLKLTRYHRYVFSAQQSSLGPGVGFEYDINLTLSPESGRTDGAASIAISDPASVLDKYGVRDAYSGSSYDNVWDGVYRSEAYGRHPFKQLELRDTNGDIIVDHKQATHAVMERFNGQVLTFELFEVSLAPTAPRYGRLISIADRNGNATTIDYVHAASSNPDIRSKLWQIASVTDTYGKRADFQYRATTVGGRWAVEHVDLPAKDDTTRPRITYSYGALNGSPMLTGVALPDGTAATFSGQVDAQEQCWVLDISDPGAAGTHRHKQVFMSLNTWTDPDTQIVYNQSPNRVRMVKTPNGEVTYRNWTGVVDGKNVRFIYQGGKRLFSFVIDGNGIGKAGYYRENFTQGDWDVVPANWNSGWRPAYTDAVANSNRFLTKKMDQLGRQIDFAVVVSHGKPLLTTHYDSTTTARTYSPSGHDWVTSETDRLGRLSTFDLDPTGNTLKHTRAAHAAVGEQSIEEWTYNGRGQPLTYKDANGNVTDYEYYENPADPGYMRLKEITEPSDLPAGPRAETSFSYDARGLVTTVTDAVGRTTSYAYDDRARLIRTTYADTSYEESTYGTGVNANLIVQKRDRSGHIATYAYDAYGRKTTVREGADSSQPGITTYTYLSGTTLAETQTVNGDKTTFEYDLEHRLVGQTVQPRNGVSLTSSNTYDDGRQLAFTSDPYGRKTYYAYDINYRVTRSVRETVPGALTGVPSTHVARNAYLNNLNHVLTANAAYLIEDSSYDAEGQVLTRTDPRGIVTKYSYDAQGRRTEVIEAFGTSVTTKSETAYDPQGNVIEVKHPRYFDSTDANGFNKARTTLTYTNRNLQKSRTEAVGVGGVEATENFTYYLDRREQDRTDGRGNVWTKLWGACCARLQAVVSPAATVDTSGTDKRSARITRHSDDGDLTHEGILADLTAATFPTLPTPTNVTDLPDAGTLREITTKYDARHRPIARTIWLSPRGGVDANNPAIAGDGGVPAGDGLTTRWVYDDDLTDNVGLDNTYSTQLATLGSGYFGTGFDGYAVEVTNPENEKSVSIFDGAGRLAMTIDGDGHASRVEYDTMVASISGAPGDLLQTTSTDALGHSNHRYSDGAARTLALKDPLGKFVLLQYDAQGNQTKVRDPNSTGEDCIYDERGRKIHCTDTENDVTKWQYDAHNNVVRSTDAKNVEEVCLFDARDRKTRCTDRNGGIAKWTYDENSNLLSIEDADAVSNSTGAKTNYVYDARNRKTSEAFPGHVASSTPNTAGYDRVVFGFDGMDRLKTRTDQKGELITLTFDLAGRVTVRGYPDGQNDTFTYDNADRLLTVQSGRYANLVTRAYNPDGTLQAEAFTTNGQTYTVGYGYDEDNRNTSITYPSGKIVARSYSDRHELANVKYDGADVITRTYDGGGRLTSTAYGNGLAESRTYRNDNLTNTLSVHGVTGFTYTWDANKNKTQETDGIVNAWSWSTGGDGYDALDRLIGWSRTNGDSQSWNLSKVGDWNSTTVNGTTENRMHDPVHQLTQQGTNLVAHDRKGNLTRKAGDAADRYGWDYNNQLLTADTDVDGTADVTFAYDALGRRTAKATSTATTVYVSAMNQEIAEYPAGTAAASPACEYVFGDYIDEIVLRVTAGTKHYYHQDALSSVRALTSQAGQVVERYAYDPYGKAIYLTSAGTLSAVHASIVGNTILYTGRRLDTETGLYYYRARYQEPVLGRFVGRDPLGYVDGMGLYDYVGNAPFSYVDPEGLQACVKDAYRQEYELSGGFQTVAKAIGIHKFSLKFHVERKECDECCQLTQYMPSKKTDISASVGFIFEAEVGSPEISKKVWGYEILKYRFGWYGRGQGSGSLTVGYSLCKGPYGGGCGSAGIELGAIVSGSVLNGRGEVGGRAGVNARVSVCGACSENGCKFYYQFCLDGRARVWAKARIWGRKREYYREWSLGGCTQQFPLDIH